MSKKTISSNLGNVYRSKQWATRWARGRPIRRVPGGWMICRKRRQKASQRKARRIRRRNRRRSSKRTNKLELIVEF